jgi:hypothetical protein
LLCGMLFPGHRCTFLFLWEERLMALEHHGPNLFAEDLKHNQSVG